MVIVQWSCNSISKEGSSTVLNVRYLDHFLSLPKIDSLGHRIGLENLMITLEFHNESEINHYIEFDSWIPEKSDSLTFLMKVPCNMKTDTMGISLSYVTSSILYLPAESRDTVVLKTNFKEVRSLMKNCLYRSSLETLEKVLPEVKLQYVYQPKNGVLTKRGRKYYPLLEFSTNL